MELLRELPDTQISGPFGRVAAVAVDQCDGESILNNVGTGLFHEKGNSSFTALFLNGSCPCQIKLTRVFAAFASGNDPVDTLEIEFYRFLGEPNLILHLEQLKEGTKLMWLIWREAHPKLKSPGKIV